MQIEDSIKEILSDIEKYSPQPEKVKLVVVTKYNVCEDMQKLFDLNYKIVAENKAQVMKEKVAYFKDRNINDIEWHFIGNLQKNKIKYIIDTVSLIHSVNSLSLAEEIDKKSKEINKITNVLLEINISNEESKHGYRIEDLYRDLKSLLELKNINIVGLMTMAPYIEDEDLVREIFCNLRKLKDELNEKFFDGKLKELSMGMTNDYKIALEEGSTIIRIGRKIFK